MDNILKGFRVINLAVNLPGPVAARQLAQYGAEVIKIEPPGGDPFAQFCLEWYNELVIGQQILRLDLKTPEGFEHINDLLAEADILITSMRPSALKRLGLDWNEIESKYPRLCHVEIIGYPPPDEEKPGHDLTYQAENGLILPPGLPRSLYADLFGAEKAVQAALMLLLKRQLTNRNGIARISLAGAVADLKSPIKYHLTGIGNLLGGGAASYNIYKTKNGWIALAALEEKFWEKLVAELGLTGVEVSKEILDKIFIQKDTADWLQWAHKYDLPISEAAQ